jgi:hypothetical protein
MSVDRASQTEISFSMSSSMIAEDTDKKGGRTFKYGIVDEGLMRWMSSDWLCTTFYASMPMACVNV